MEGLEASLVRLSALEFSGRIDSEYYQKLFLELEATVAGGPSSRLGTLAEFLIGPFGSSFTVENYVEERVYRYIRGKDVKPLTLKDNDNVYMAEEDFGRLIKYALREDDVLVSVVGTIGNAALVTPRDLPAVFSCKNSVIRTSSLNPAYLTVYLNCKFGSSLMLRKERGAIQKGLNLDDLKDVIVAAPSSSIQIAIESAFRRSLALSQQAKSAIMHAENLLLRDLGLSDWMPPEPLSYSANVSDVFRAGRLDARFFAPRIQVLLDILGRDGRLLRHLGACCT